MKVAADCARKFISLWKLVSIYSRRRADQGDGDEFGVWSPAVGQRHHDRLPADDSTRHQSGSGKTGLARFKPSGRYMVITEKIFQSLSLAVLRSQVILYLRIFSNEIDQFKKVLRCLHLCLIDYYPR